MTVHPRRSFAGGGRSGVGVSLRDARRSRRHAGALHRCSLTKPIQPTLDAFSARTGIVVQRESGASLEHVRKITELHRVPDVILLADADVFPSLLIPKHASWYAEFARNRMVI